MSKCKLWKEHYTIARAYASPLKAAQIAWWFVKVAKESKQ